LEAFLDLQLSDKTALVLAASKGIGAGVARGLAMAGCRVAIASSNRDNIVRRAEIIVAETGADVRAYQIDVSQPEEAGAATERIVAELGGIDIAVLNGPGPAPQDVAALKLASVRSAIETHLLSAIAVTNAVLPGMRHRRFGRILALSSSTAREPDEGMCLSSMARAALLAYVKTVAREVSKDGITANAILTGGVLTDRIRELMAHEARDAGQDFDAYLLGAAATIPAGYIPTPDQFAPTLVYLASPLAGYINGVALPIDGGFMRAL
jgi:3-oxoacyl-[acyl-carrier protein] reductase